MKPKLALLLVWSLAAYNVFAADIVYWPPVLTNRTPITIDWQETPRMLGDAAVKVEGSRVTVQVVDKGCVLAAPCISAGTVELPPLPGGDYELVLKTTDDEVLDTKTFSVYDVTTVPLFPNGGPLDPGTTLFYWPRQAELELNFGANGRGRIDSRSGMILVPRATQADVVDIQYSNSERGISGVARNAFIYTDGDACRDERIWEKVLIPTDYTGAGAYGSFWRTEVSVHGPGARVIGPGNPCPFRDETFGTGGTRPGGYFLRVARSSAHLMQYRVRVSDTSTDAASLPVEMPVLRENEWLREWTQIQLPQPSPNRRVTLRLYAPDGAIDYVDVNRGAHRVQLQDMGPDAPRFASLDISNASGTLYIWPHAGGNNRYRYWAVVTVTDNVTQQVYVYAAPKGQ